MTLTRARVAAAAAQVVPAGVDPRLGQLLLGRYRLLSRVGAGGMGTVYEAEQLPTHRHVAVKLLQAGLGKIDLIRRRFEREAVAAARLGHPHIVDVVDYGVLDDGAVFLVMELVRGESLGDLIEAASDLGQALPASRALTIARQVLGALVAAHAAGVVHRDLKPDNVMITATGPRGGDHAMLLDFGIAKLLSHDDGAHEELTQVGVAFGTPEYMSPEQARGEMVDARADQYAFGVLLFELLTGLRPFEADDKIALLHLHMGKAPPTLAASGAGERATPAFEAIVARCLAKRREDRFADTPELLAAFEAAAAELLGPPRARSVPVTQSAVATPRKRRVRLVVGLAIVVIGFGVGLWRRHGARAELGPGLATAGLVAGRVYAQAGRAADALGAYDLVLAVEPARKTDATLVADVTRLAARAVRAEDRARARELAGALDVLAQVDLLTSYLADLATPGPCAARRRAIAPLRALKDKRALPELRRARAAGSDNACLSRDAREAIDFLEALP